MNWIKDDAGISERDLDKIYKYDEKPAIVTTLRPGRAPKISVLETEKDWDIKLAQECPDRISNDRPGIVLVLAQRPDQKRHSPTKQVPCDQWLELDRAERKEWGEPEELPATGGQRSARSVPFSKETFRKMTRRLRIHASISSAISRADVPVISSAEVQMVDLSGQSHCALVYNCRSSNAWPDDMALSVTYFPHVDLTYAIWFGCTSLIERDIIHRLSTLALGATHPLLLPGIFVEVERLRHIRVADSTIAEMENRIAELSFRPSDVDEAFDADADTRHANRTSAWLNTAYLKNHLISWKAQLDKMELHIDELKATVFRADRAKTMGEPLVSPGDGTLVERGQNLSARGNQATVLYSNSLNPPATAQRSHDWLSDVKTPRICCERCGSVGYNDGPDGQLYKEQMSAIGDRIAGRLRAIQEEYDGKIRDCTIRVDGMSMATQWAQGETNLAIALATNRDSKHMRSIALVTMIFLPGTLVASIFSMTFFQWDNDDDSIVSHFFWVYVVFTVVFTGLTVGSWWYFVVYRQSHRRKLPSEDAISLSNV